MCDTQDQHPGIWDHRAPTVARRPALSERKVMTFDQWLQPPDPHECDNPDCDGDLCAEQALEAVQADAQDRADSIRKGEW